jgi:hypothetical protein
VRNTKKELIEQKKELLELLAELLEEFDDEKVKTFNQSGLIG